MSSDFADSFYSPVRCGLSLAAFEPACGVRSLDAVHPPPQHGKVQDRWLSESLGKIIRWLTVMNRKRTHSVLIRLVDRPCTDHSSETRSLECNPGPDSAQCELHCARHLPVRVSVPFRDIEW